MEKTAWTGATALICAVLCGPALAEPAARASATRVIADFDIGARPVEVLAAPRRAHFDTAIRKDYLHDCESMAKVMPGYPQPAFVTFNLRMKF